MDVADNTDRLSCTNSEVQLLNRVDLVEILLSHYQRAEVRNISKMNLVSLTYISESKEMFEEGY